MFDITSFTLQDMTRCGAALRGLGDGAASMEATADRIVRFLDDHLRDSAGAKACALARLFITRRYRDLDADLQRHAQRLLGAMPEDTGLLCQTLLATVGAQPGWNDRRRSTYYKTLPLTPEVIEQNPMYLQFAETFGVILDRSVTPDPQLIADLEQTSYNVFHVPDALGSPYIPDQEHFVIPCGIRSVLGFFGMLPSGQIYSVVIFTRVAIPRAIVTYLKSLAFHVKLAILPFDEIAVFADTPIAAPDDQRRQMAQLRSEVGGLRQLVEVQEQVVIEQAQHLSALLDERRRQAEQLAATNSDLERQIAENERLRQQAAERAILEERNRLARDLHDSVTQSLYSLTLFAEASQRLLSGGSGERAAAYLGRIGETAQQTLKEMRLLVYELRPLALERTGLVGALQQRLEAVEGRAGVAARLRVEGAIALAPAAEEGLYHIAQEALNNALKHAHAQTVEIRLTATDAHLRLTVEDDGQGFNPHQERGGGMGLVSMHERAAGLGATLDIASVPGTGTQVRLELQHAQQG